MTPSMGRLTRSGRRRSPTRQGADLPEVVSSRATTVRGVSNQFADWIAAYEMAWRTEGTAPLRRLFTEDATYQAAPFDEPLAGVEAIARFWEDEREGPDEAFTLTSEIVAAQGDTAVARLEIVYGDQPQRTYRDLWIITLSSDGRCRHFEEWPFHPGQARTAL
jgi:ketosteroid isomerase-like protein